MADSGDDLGFFDYLKAAFRHGPRVPLLGKMPLNQLGLVTFGVLGLVSPGFWLLGVALETSYLTFLASNQRFQALVRGEKLLAAREDYQTRVRAVHDRLSGPSQRRYRRLLAQCQEILGISETLDGGDGITIMRSARTGGLNQLLWIFLRLLISHELLNDSIRRVDRGAIAEEVKDLEARIATEDPESALARSLRGTLEIQKKRLDNAEQARQSLQVIEAELERIERQVSLLREEAVASGKAEFLSSRLDVVTGELTETNRWMEQNAEIFGSLGVDPLGSAPDDLPEMPQTMETE
jgi:predicted ribosome quality control (RQC) complex YloA/Tae2 family protein